MATMPEQLLKLLMDYDWFMEHRDIVVPTMFPGDLETVFETIKTAHERFKHNLTIDEVRELHRTQHPTLSRAARNNIEEVFVDLSEIGTISPDVATVVLESMWRTETFRELADICVSGMEGKVEDLESIRRIIDARSETFLPADDVEFVPSDLDELLEVNEKAGQWSVNIESLAEKLPKLGEGEFVIGFARPEVGKTAFYTSLCCAPGGFAWQGANVHVITNEEPGRRTLLRAVTAATQQDKDWVMGHKGEARKIWNQIKDNFTVADAVGMSLGRLDAYARRWRPDILVIDQLDKIHIGGQFAGNHDRLGAIYIGAREIAKKYHCLVFALSQCSAEGEKKAIIDYSMLAGSKTDKAAEADVIIGIGKYPQMEGGTEEDFTRPLTVSKNKISSWHGTVYSVLNPATSTYKS